MVHVSRRDKATATSKKLGPIKTNLDLFDREHLPDNMHVMPVHLDQRGSFLPSSAIATSRLLPPKNLDRSKRNKMCSKDNDFAVHMHEAAIDLVQFFFWALARKSVRPPPC